METVFDKPLDTEVANRLKFTAPGDITASNIDDYVSTGLYQAYFNANINNGVAGAWGTLQVVHVNSAVVEQTMITPLGIAIRHKEYSTWSSWSRIKSQTDLYTGEELAGKYNGSDMYRKIFVTGAITFPYQTATEIVFENGTAPTRAKTICASFTIIVFSPSQIVEFPDQYNRVHMYGDKYYLTQSVTGGNGYTASIRADIYYVK